MEKEKNIKEGTIWVCKKTVRMKERGDIAYIEGKLYKSECSGCLTDEMGFTHHYWTEDIDSDAYKLFPEYFKQVPKNKRSRWKTK